MEYQYKKVRSSFGRPCRFTEKAPHFLDSIEPNVTEDRLYCLRNPVHREIQATVPLSEKTTSTKYVTTTSTGVNHVEGGWPKYVNYLDVEATSRYLRHEQRSDDYVHAVLSTYENFEHFIKQNNNLDLYQIYYKDFPGFESFQTPSYQLLKNVKDPLDKASKRPVACFDWNCDSSKLVVSHCYKTCPFHVISDNRELEGYAWDMNKLSEPYYTFLPPTACWQVVYSANSPDYIIGGLADGRVCLFDMRKDKKPVHVSDIHLANNGPITSLVKTDYRLGNNFMCGSTDGLCIWYDIRDLSKPIYSLYISILLDLQEQPNMTNAEPVSVLQFQKERPSRFLCGTDTGLMINVNCKGKSHNEMYGVFEAHLGPVKALQRNPFIMKMIISCGDWSTRIWNENIQTSPVITDISRRYKIQDVVWSPGRVSGYMSVDSNGKFRYWDLLRNQREPILVIPLSKQALLHIKPQLDGRIIGVGDTEGNMYFLSLSESLAECTTEEKDLMLQMLEFNSRREKILELRIKEIRIRTNPDKETTTNEKIDDLDNNFESVEKEYRKIVIQAANTVFRNRGQSSSQSTQSTKYLEKKRN